jgi:hypothetical protein
MAFDELLDDYRRRFPRNGCFELREGESIRTRAEEERVPREPGVYLIYGRKERRRELLYVGKAGTLRQDGVFKRQKLRGRLSARQKGMSRQRWYQNQMRRLGLDALVFLWFVTFDDSVRVVPSKAEADLLQAYFDDENRLPRWNESA